PLDEVQTIGRELRDILKGEEGMDPNQALQERPHPTLLKYAAESTYLKETAEDLKKFADTLAQAAPRSTLSNPTLTSVRLLRDDAQAETRIATALLSRSSHLSTDELFARLKQDATLAQRVIETALAKRGSHDTPLREFEHAQFEHEIIMDYGAWRDIQRHRLCTQTNQTLSPHLGYAMPEEIGLLGFGDRFQTLMDEAARVYKTLKNLGLEQEAAYAIPMAYRRRLLVSWNLRELFHFIELRSGVKGHPSYRKIAQDVWRTIEQAHPLLAKHIRVDLRGTEATTSWVGAKPKLN
ncbi:MAG: FAD-dependent thymidylate synthase, partial [bacterium]|nr:FAD-dependent thymidylate synthase [bacterium]